MRRYTQPDEGTRAARSGYRACPYQSCSTTASYPPEHHPLPACPWADFRPADENRPHDTPISRNRECQGSRYILPLSESKTASQAPFGSREETLPAL